MVSYLDVRPIFIRKGSLVCSMFANRLNPHSKSGRFTSRMAILLLGVLVILAGCGGDSSGTSDDDGHRFATERRPTHVPTETAVPTEIVTLASVPAEPTPEPRLALEVRGAPRFAYFMTDDQVQVYDTGNRTFTPLNIPDGLSVLEFASSPTGDRVGLLGLLDDEVVVQFYGGDGEPLGDPIPLQASFSSAQSTPAASPAATPTVSRSPHQLRINWIPQGNGVVISGPGVLKRVSMNGVLMPISRAGVTGTVVNAFWSPMDSQVAILTQLQDGHQGVFMLDSGRADASELNVLHLQPNQSLSNLQWLPNGLGMVMVAGNSSDGVLMNGQIYVYRFSEDVPELVATSGQGGPAATITHAVVSPDGHSVAYVIMVRDLNEWHLHSVWVKPIRGGPGVSIPLESSSPVTTLVWTAEGLVWQQEDGGIWVVDVNLMPRPLGEEPVATPVASPQSTPVPEPTPSG